MSRVASIDVRLEQPMCMGRILNALLREDWTYDYYGEIHHATARPKHGQLKWLWRPLTDWSAVREDLAGRDDAGIALLLLDGTGGGMFDLQQGTEISILLDASRVGLRACPSLTDASYYLERVIGSLVEGGIMVTGYDCTDFE